MIQVDREIGENPCIGGKIVVNCTSDIHTKAGVVNPAKAANDANQKGLVTLVSKRDVYWRQEPPARVFLYLATNFLPGFRSRFSTAMIEVGGDEIMQT